MKIALTYSSKAGLLDEYRQRFGEDISEGEIPEDCFAEGDTPETINAVMSALRSGGHRVNGLDSNCDVARELQELRPDLVFNIAEGLFGDFRESYVPFICERLGLNYTGSDPLTLALCLNKARAKEILSYYQVANPAFRVLYPLRPIDLAGVQFPAIVKPVSEGSSKGIYDDSVVEDPAQAQRKVEELFDLYRQPVLIEQFLQGQEFTVALWGNGSNVEVLPIVAIDHSRLPVTAHAIYSYEAKWEWDTPDKPLEIFKCPADISPALQAGIEETVRRAYRVMNIRDWCRIDVRLDENETPHILELNPLPGILPNPRENSCFPKAARTAGYRYEEMILKVVGFAMERNGSAHAAR